VERTTSSSRAAALDVRADLPAARAAAGDALTDRLPELLDCKALRAELGVTRVTAEAIMRAVPTVQIAGLRKVYVKREDVRRYLDAHTFARDQAPA
jgi:hypothetical protein